MDQVSAPTREAIGVERRAAGCGTAASFILAISSLTTSVWTEVVLVETQSTHTCPKSDDLEALATGERLWHLGKFVRDMYLAVDVCCSFDFVVLHPCSRPCFHRSVHDG